MKTQQQFTTPAVVAVFAVALLGAPTGAAAAETLLVPQDFPTIQAAIDAATDGDEVIVADGVYEGEGNTNMSFLGKAITVRSANGPGHTVIDCGEDLFSVRAFQFNSGEGPDSVLEGFTIRNGFGAPGGGGIRIMAASPTIRNCIITGCYGFNEGGGIEVTLGGNPTIIDCTFSGNISDCFGGAISFHTAAGGTIHNCVFNSNLGLGHAGALRLAGGGVAITNSAFIGNQSGAIFISGSAEISIVNCLIAGSRDGAGIHVGGSAAQIINCTIALNAGSSAGGISGHATGEPLIENSILWGNMASAGDSSQIGAENSILENSLIQGGWDGAGMGNVDADPLFSLGPAGAWTEAPLHDAASDHTVFTDADATFDPGALRGQLLQPDLDDVRLLLINDNTETSILVQGNLTWWYFAFSNHGHASNGDETYQVYSLRPGPGSPAIDAGDNAAVPPEITTDLDGNPRIVDGTGDGAAVVDLGAYEFQLGDLTGSGMVGVDDLLILLAEWGDCDDPRNCPADLNGDGLVNIDDLLILLANWNP